MPLTPTNLQQWAGKGVQQNINDMFIEKADLGQSIYTEVLDTISRADQTFIDSNIGRAVEEVDGYLNQKYDTEVLWAQVAPNRNKTIKGLCVDVSLYHIHSVTEETPVIIRERYDYAKTMLKDIRKGEIKLTGIPLLADDEDETNNEIITGNNSTRH